MKNKSGFVNPGNSKLTKAQVSEIKQRIGAGDMLKDIASEYKVDSSTISHIKRGFTWTGA